LKDKGRRDHTLISAIPGPRSGVHFRPPDLTVADINCSSAPLSLIAFALTWASSSPLRDCILELALRRAAPASFPRERALPVRDLPPPSRAPRLQLAIPGFAVLTRAASGCMPRGVFEGYDSVALRRFIRFLPSDGAGPQQGKAASTLTARPSSSASDPRPPPRTLI
jgi:hypothetical protein